MNKIGSYVDGLFAHYRNTPKIRELKEEIQGNLEARYADLLAQGRSEQQAMEAVRQSFPSADRFIEGNHEVRVGLFRRELLQWALIDLLIACIVATPMLMVYIGRPLSALLFLVTIAVGVFYAYSGSGARGLTKDRTAFFSYPHYKKLSRLVWLLWGLFTVVYAAAATGMYFGSNIWFSRKVSIHGPYELAVLIVLYSVPFFTLILPLLFQKIPALILKYEVGADEEEK